MTTAIDDFLYTENVAELEAEMHQQPAIQVPRAADLGPWDTSWDEFASQNKELKTGGPRSEWGFRRAIHETINSLHVGQFFGDLKYLSNAQKFHVELRVRNLRINASSTQRKSFVRNPSRTEKTTQKINKRHFLKMINVFSVHETHATPRRCSGSSNSDCIRQFFHLL